MTGVLIRIGNLDKHMEGRWYEEIQGEDSHRHTRERGPEQTPPPWPLEGTNPATNLTLRERKLIFVTKVTSYWYLATAALAD